MLLNFKKILNNKNFLIINIFKFIDNIGRIEKSDLKFKFEKLKNSKTIYQSHLDNEKNINEKLDILKIKNNKIKALNPTENEYEELANKRNLNKNIKKYSEISDEIKNLISKINLNDHYSSIEKYLIKLKEINQDYSDISEKFTSSMLDINEIINSLDNKFNSEDYIEVDFNVIDEKIYQYQQLSKFFDVEPSKLFSIKHELLNEIDSLENFEKEKNILFKNYTNDLNDYKKEALKISNLRKNESKKYQKILINNFHL